MGSGPGIADLQRWSEEVARDPGSPSFLPLAEAYRRMGKTQAALRVCLRGLERSPGSVDAHLLLARLYLELGDRERAADEWAVCARLDPDNFEAHRGLGFFHLERGEFSSAGRHLERAALARPGDPAVQEALSVLRRQRTRGATAGRGGVATNGAGRAPASAAGGVAEDGAAPAPAEAGAGPPAPAAGHAAGPGSAGPNGGAVGPSGVAADAAPPVAGPVMEVGPVTGAAEPAGGPAGGAGEHDPARVFEPLTREVPFLAALLLDARGLVLAASIRAEGMGRSEALGAVVGTAAEEAARTAELLSIGSWRGILLETDRALLHVAPLGQELRVLVAAESGTPAGWLLRTAERAAELARRFLERGA